MARTLSAPRVVATRYHGSISVDPQDVWHCAAPILGFASYRDYVWLPHPTLGHLSPFRVWQSLDQPELAFVTVPLAWTVLPDGVPTDVARWGLTGDPQSWIWIALCTTSPHQPTTANLRSPLAFHPVTRRGGQIVLDNPDLPWTWPIDPAYVTPTGILHWPRS